MKSAVWFITMNCNMNCPYCSPAGSLILMADMSCKKIEDVKVGDTIIGFKKSSKGKHHIFVESKVLAIGNREAECNNVFLENGRSVECSTDHHWWNGRSYQIAYEGMKMFDTVKPIENKITDDFKMGYLHGAFAGDGCLFFREKSVKGSIKKYADYQSLFRTIDKEMVDRVRDYLLYFGFKMNEFEYISTTKQNKKECRMFGIRSFKKKTYDFLKNSLTEESSDEFKRGWLSGIYDSEGSLTDVIHITQKKEPTKSQIKSVLKHFNFECRVDIRSNGTKDFRIIKKAEQVRFLNLVNCAISRKRSISKLGRISTSTKVLRKTHSGFKRVYSLTTETGNYIVNGFLSKNCWERQRQERGEFKPEPYIDSMKWVEAWNRLNFDVIDITGGEPFLQPNFIEMVNKISAKIAITTNIKQDLTEFVQKVSPEKVFSMTLSFHPTQNLNILHFTGKAMLLSMRGFNITINIVAYPEQMFMIPYLKSHFNNIGINVHIDPYSQTPYKPFEMNEQEKKFVQMFTGADRMNAFIDEVRPVNCSGGVNHLTVFPDGKAYRCINDKIKDIPPIGNILDEDFNLLPSWEYCEDYNKCAGCNKDKVKVENAKCLI